MTVPARSPFGPPLGWRRSAQRAAVGGGLLLGASLLTIGPALAAGTVTVSQTEELDPTGQQVTVTGAGFDETIGIYVAVCVDNGPDALPTPCIGGVDTSGGAESSAWISSNPPSYADGLTTPYGPGGSFEVTLSVVGSDPKTGVDCSAVICAVVTRADHTRPDDRSQDTRTPLTFSAPGGADPAPPSSEPDPAPPSSEPTELPSSEPSEPTPAPSTAPAEGVRTITATAAAVVADTPPDDEADSGNPTVAWSIGGIAAAGAAVAIFFRTRRNSITRGNAT